MLTFKYLMQSPASVLCLIAIDIFLRQTSRSVRAGSKLSTATTACCSPHSVRQRCKDFSRRPHHYSCRPLQHHYQSASTSFSYQRGCTPHHRQASVSSTTSPTPWSTCTGYQSANASNSSCAHWLASASAAQRRPTWPTCVSLCRRCLVGGRTHLRSAIHCDLVIPRTRLARYGPRSFAVSGSSNLEQSAA